ncbi:hypothetical protein L6R52_26310 [Myxococcota bacterium]|nr:hypothetical protein [Myxococcota bacterium]
MTTVFAGSPVWSARAVRALLVLSCALSLPRIAGAATIAVPEAAAPAKSGADKLEKQLEATLTGAGHEVVGDATLAKAAKKVKAAKTSVKAAREAGAEWLVTIKVTKGKKGFSVEAKLVEVATDRAVSTAERSYAKPAGAGAAGEAIGRELVAAIKEDEEAKAAEEARSKVITPPEEEVPPTPAIEEKKAEVEPEPEPDRPSGTGEGKMLRFHAGAGSQVASAYTVSVGDAATGLAYDLSPLLLVEAGARFLVPKTGLSLGVEFAFVPVKYDIQVEPAVTPTDPGGSFMDLALTVAYQLELAKLGAKGSLYVAPLLGFRYTALSVDEQTPYAVVVSSTLLAPEAGVLFGVGLGALAIEAHAKVDLAVSYEETPVTTGADGSGLGLDVGATGRLWFGDLLGAYLGLGYDFAKVSLSGTGTRTRFVDDPELVDASISTGNLRVGVGVLVAL